jgi:FGGY-family pentulose kinase
MDRFVVGVDVGTGSARAGVFRVTEGARVGIATHPIKIWRPQPEFVEQSSDDIWDAVGFAVRTAVADAGIDPGAVIGIGFDATCSLVALDGDDRPVTVSPSGNDAQNVIVWMDHRALAEADAINAGGHDVLRYVGGAISPEMELPKLRWLKTHLPDTWSRAARFLDLADFLTATASGQDIRSLCTTVCKWTYLGHEDRWDTAFLDAIGLDDPRITAPPIRPVGEAIGPLTAAAAAHLGLTPRCQVAVGIIDAHAGGLGLLGMAADDPLSALAVIGGTSNCHMAASHEPFFIPGVWGPYFGAMVPGLWLTEGGQSAAGSLIDHVIQDSSAYAALAYEADAKKTTVYALLNERVAKLAAHESLTDVSLLTRELHVLDYHLGNRSPFADPRARGVIDGLPLDDSQELDARLYLATIQAVAYGTRAIVDALNAAGFRITRLLATGGGTRNPLWLQQHADATGLTIVLGAESESVLLGSAVLAAHASGAYDSVIAAMAALSQPGDAIAPNPAMRAYHDAKYAVYQDLYASQKRHRARMAAV